MKEAFKYSFMLFSICLAAAILLSATYAVTQPRIEETRQEQQNSAIKEVLPEAGHTKKIEKAGLVYYAALNAKGERIGYIFTCEAKGYSSMIRAVVSVRPDGKIIAVKVMEHNETPGIGSRINEEGFLRNFKDKTKQVDIDTITGATISSGALINSVRATMEKIFP